MATKRVLNRIRLDKIAAVDLPCQEHATVAIVKRAPSAGAPPAIVKKTFQEALSAQLISEKISDTFWRAFENQWAVRDAFRVALSDEITEGGDGTDAISGFTAAMQTIASTAADLAREAASTAEPDLTSAVEDAVSKWLQTQTEEQNMKITTKALLATAVAGFALAKSSAADAVAIIDAAVELDALAALDANADLAKMAEDKKKKKTDDQTVKSLAREVAVLKMAPAIRKHYDGLADDTARDAFVSKSVADQQAEVDAVDQADPVVHKCKDGTAIRKSDGAAVLALAKRNDELITEVSDLRAGQSASDFEKRAASEFPGVASATAVAMLKSASSLGPDTDAGKAVLTSLGEMNKARTSLFKSLGSSEVAEVSGSVKKSREDFDGEVRKARTDDPSLGYAGAMAKVRTDQPELYAAAYPETVEEQDA